MARIAITSLTIAVLGLVAVRAASNDDTAAAIQTVQSEVRDVHGNTPLMIAAAHGQVDQVRALIATGAWIGARSGIGNTALNYAAQEGHLEVARLLLAAGANPDTANDYGNTPRRLALGHGHRGLVALFEAVPVRGGGLLAGGF